MTNYSLCNMNYYHNYSSRKYNCEKSLTRIWNHFRMDLEKCIKDNRRDVFSQVRTNILRTITNGISDMPTDTYDALYKILLACSKDTLYNRLIRLQCVHEPEAYVEVLKLLVLDNEELEILMDALHDQIKLEY